MFRAWCKNSSGNTLLTASTQELLHMKIRNLTNYDSSYVLVCEDYIDLSDISKYVTKFI